MKALTGDDNGFSFVELLVVMAVAAVVLSGIYGTYRILVGSHAGQEQVVEMQQNLRNAMYYMRRSVRMSGFDPQRTGLMGFVVNFAAPYNTLGATTDARHIAFALDSDQDGVLDANELELVAYRLNGDQLQKLTFDGGAPPTASWMTVAENVDALNFVYMDGDNPPNMLAPPLTAAALSQIRSVQITLVVRAGDTPSPLANPTTDNTVYRNQQGTVIFHGGGDKFRRRSVTAQLNCRNLGL